MKTQQLCFLASIITLLISACSENKSAYEKSLSDCPVVATREKAGNDQIVVLHTDRLKDTLNIPLSQLVENFEIIKLDSRDEALVKGGPTFITDNYIGVYSNDMPYKLFDKKGNFLHPIGNIGQGPNEYRLLYNSQIDEKNNRIYLLPWQTKQVLVYDLAGSNLPPIPMPCFMPKSVFRVDTEKELLTAGILPFSNSRAIVWQQDFKGNVLREVDAAPFGGYDDYSNEVSSGQNTGAFDFSIFHWAEQEDSLYHYNAEQNRLIPVFTANFGTVDLPKHGYGELPGIFMADIITQVVNGTGVGHAHILVDKQTLKGCYFNIVNDFLGNMLITMPMYYFANGRFLQNIDPGDLQEALEAILSQPENISASEVEKLTELHHSMSVNDNNYILTGTLKTVTDELIESVEASPMPKPKVKQVTTKSEDSTKMKEEAEDPDIPYYTAALTTWRSYFRTNNKYKDWDSANPQKVMIQADIDKYGKPHNVRLLRSSEKKELDEEAIRLIQEAPIDPASNKDGDPIEHPNWVIPVYFPPK